MERLQIKRNTSTLEVFLLLFFITLSKYNVSIGFSLKIYMIFLAVFFCIYFRDFYFRPLYHYEILLLLFYFTYCLSGAFSQYPEASIRVILGVILVLICYFIMRYMLEQASIPAIESSIANVGILFNMISLLLYMIGLQIIGGSPTGVEITSYGLLLDRDYPRLIGLLDDPNIFIFYNTLFFSFYLTHLKGFKHSFGFILCIITNLLTFSRGGIVALILVVILYIILADFLKKVKMIMIALLCLVVIYAACSFMQIDLNQIISSRINDFSSDKGSGRFELWEQAINYFMSHPLLGIGAFNFSDYYAFEHNEKLYVHNTYLEILVEAGIIGFLFYFSFLFLFIIKLFRTKLHNKEPFIILTLFAFLLQMVSLSLMINEALFSFLAIALKYISVYERKEAGFYDIHQKR
ncbi:O-antigen ligase family protein [Bacillus pseudomycoides]|uniref:O-antigen ligase family protein n=2 Tax=Bacillus pseudomycoides TaxID=64104 RepID=UPI000BEDDF52|nr:O-antigen ligase family protein [Bacillus pseudomycoides]PED07230.1 polysaccharide polymerase [Bacillus pseudomycoides]PEI98706.1 polysaccharide polymerase [Bacillus pseudomycoides]PEM77489.1 polysaccharide polymerase [Bacillus pseudomycoides]PEO21552.1 polysaccharide polymerase [Bacillus pseudomycoides]PEP68301.1 polysaccharide polymerase [Bacillus pseudomycoides]